MSSATADLLDLALVQDHDPVGELKRFFLVVRHEDRGVAGAVVNLAQPAAQLTAHLGVERAERLIEQKQPRLDRERAGKCDALALAAGQLIWKPLIEAGELDEVEQRHHPIADRLLIGAGLAGAHAQTEGDVLEHAHVPEQRVALEHEADVALLHGLAGGVLIAEQDAALIGKIEARNQAQQGGLARARRARAARAARRL